VEPLGLAIAVVVAGLVVVWLHHPRIGLVIMGGACGLAGLVRLLLPRYAGLLQVRSRTQDTVVLWLLAAGLVVSALVVPFPPPAG
jgi:hypothetical protein